MLADPLYLENARLTDRNLELEARLLSVRDCHDLRCNLCAACLAAVFPPSALGAVPPTDEADPIRHWRKSRRWGSVR